MDGLGDAGERGQGLVLQRRVWRPAFGQEEDLPVRGEPAGAVLLSRVSTHTHTPLRATTVAFAVRRILAPFN
jgi:hypothetical protein